MTLKGTYDAFGNYVPSALDERLHRLSLEAAARQVPDTRSINQGNYGARSELYLQGAFDALAHALKEPNNLVALKTFVESLEALEQG